MVQVVVDCGPASAGLEDGNDVAVGDRAVLFGPGDAGEPTAQDWADELGTIHYEVVTGVRGRVRRTVVGGAVQDRTGWDRTGPNGTGA
jgi:alanine racemase